MNQSKEQSAKSAEQEEIDRLTSENEHLHARLSSLESSVEALRVAHNQSADAYNQATGLIRALNQQAHATNFSIINMEYAMTRMVPAIEAGVTYPQLIANNPSPPEREPEPAELPTMPKVGPLAQSAKAGDNGSSNQAVGGLTRRISEWTAVTESEEVQREPARKAPRLHRSQQERENQAQATYARDRTRYNGVDPAHLAAVEAESAQQLERMKWMHAGMQLQKHISESNGKGKERARE